MRVSSIGLARGDDGATIIRWSEQRPDLQGRTVVCRSVVPVGNEPVVEPVIEGPSEMSARSGVNEYGGGSWWADGERLHWTDGLSGAVVTCSSIGGAAVVLSALPPTSRGWRHAAGVLTPPGAVRWVICEREVHPGSEIVHRADAVAGATIAALVEPANELAVLAVAADGGALEGGPLAPVTLVRDGDWAVAPALSPDGTTLAWLRWDHPDMPWDSAEVWAARVQYPDDPPLGSVPIVTDARRVAGGHAGGAARGLDRPVAACLPEWSPDGRLWWCDDAADWWQLRCGDEPGLPDSGAGDLGGPALDVPGEVGEPRWVSGGRRYGFTDDGRVVLAIAHEGLDSVQVWDPDTDELSAVASPTGGFTSVEHLAVLGQVVAVAGGGGAVAVSAWSVDLRTDRVVDQRARSLAAAAGAGESGEPAGAVSSPRSISFPTHSGEQAHALFYAPASAVAVGPDSELPPLMVRIHGGPTASARAELSASVQFWTSRGFAVVDVNYRGSTGYGRRYRDLLRGEWGVVDVADCVAATRWLAGQGLVDGRRCVIRGGSAGGFTALEAACRSDAFAAACSLYGVTDLRALAADTHKFESRYLDGLVGPYPAEAEKYRERSPLFHAELLDRPVLLLQGTEDPIVPPSQAEVLRAALHEGGVPHALILFSGEAHGFRSDATIVRALQAELAFYGQVLGVTPADDLPHLDLQR